MKKVLVICLGIMVALAAMASSQKRSMRTRAQRVAPSELVRRTPVKKAPAQLNGETYTISGNDLFITPDDYFDLYMAFYEYGIVDFQGGFAGQYAIAGVMNVYDEDPAKWYGDYDADNVMGAVYDMSKDGDEGTDVTFSSFKYEKTAKGDQITAVAADEAGNTYNVTLTFFAPEKANDTIKIDFSQEAMLSRETGLYYSAKNDKYFVQMDMNTSKLEGVFVDADFNKQYTGVWAITGKDTVHTGVPFNCKAEIKLVDGVYNVNAELFASGDSVLYQVSMKYTKPTAKTTVQVNLQDALLEDWMEDYGTLDMQAAPADSSYLISLSTKTEKAEGTYTDADLDLYYSFVKVGAQYNDIFEAEYTISANTDGTYTYTGWLLAANNVKYEFVIKTVAAQAIDNLREGAVATKRLENGRLVIEKNGVLYDAVGARVQ